MAEDKMVMRRDALKNYSRENSLRRSAVRESPAQEQSR